MTSSSGASSGSTQLQNSGYEEAQRKRKRMISNRESARRSRMRKQKHLDDLVDQVSRLRSENYRIHANTNVATQVYLNVDAENSVLRAQLAELTHRLQSLNEIIDCLDSNGGLFEMDGGDEFSNPWDLAHVSQPIMASVDMFMMH